MAALEELLWKFEALDGMMVDCALIFSTSLEGNMSVSQRHVLLGVIFDTHKWRMFITADKFVKLVKLLEEIMQLVACSPRSIMMTKLRGKSS